MSVETNAKAVDFVTAKKRIQAHAEASRRGLVYIRSFPTNKEWKEKKDRPTRGYKT